MASVVDTSVKHFHSGMSGAPLLSGQAGKLIDVLDACLVNGFDVKTVTSLVVAGGMATLNFVGAHSATIDSVILVAGASIAELNGEQKVTAIDAGKVQFATAAANATASGSITFKMAPAGFDKPFAGTNLAVYKSANVQANGLFFRVNDTNATDARLIGYETMTAVSTGTGLFPTTAQLNGGLYWSKSQSPGAGSIPWAMFSDGRFVLFRASMYFIDAGPDYLSGWLLGFGDPIPLRAGGDVWSTMLAGGDSTGVNSAASSGGLSQGSIGVAGSLSMARPLSGVGSASPFACPAYTGSAGASSGVDQLMGPFPSAASGGLILSRRYLVETNPATGQPLAPRAVLPGLLTCPQSQVARVIANRQIVPAAGELSGRRLMAIHCGYPQYSLTSNPDSVAVAFIDLTGPWR